MLTRRGLVRVLGGLVAAPAIVPVSSLMGLRGVPLMPALDGNAEVIRFLEEWLHRARAGKLNFVGLVGGGGNGELTSDFITSLGQSQYELMYGLDFLRRQVIGSAIKYEAGDDVTCDGAGG